MQRCICGGVSSHLLRHRRMWLVNLEHLKGGKYVGKSRSLYAVGKKLPYQSCPTDRSNGSRNHRMICTSILSRALVWPPFTFIKEVSWDCRKGGEGGNSDPWAPYRNIHLRRSLSLYAISNVTLLISPPWLLKNCTNGGCSSDNPLTHLTWERVSFWLFLFGETNHTSREKCITQWL